MSTDTGLRHDTNLIGRAVTAIRDNANTNAAQAPEFMRCVAALLQDIRQSMLSLWPAEEPLAGRALAAARLYLDQQQTAAIADTGAILIVSFSYTVCGKCRKGAVPEEQTHQTVTGYGNPQQPGCGARFTAIACDRSRIDDAWRQRLSEMRPDLPIVTLLDREPDYVQGARRA